MKISFDFGFVEIRNTIFVSMERDLCLSEAVAFWEVVEDVVALVVQHDDFEGGEFFVFGETVLFKNEHY